VKGIVATPTAEEADEASPFDAKNPYSFAEWEGEPSLLEEPSRAQHDRWDEARHSGRITVNLTAWSPLFVPAGDGADEDTGKAQRLDQNWWQPLYSCVDSEGVSRSCIPGSSVKGAQRSLFETWTNSHLTIIDESHYKKPIPYRRRIATAWVIETPTATGLAVRGCRVEFVYRDKAGWWRRTQGQPVRWDEKELGPLPLKEPRPDAVVNLANTSSWQLVPYRANLYWVRDHRHRWKYLAVKVKADKATISNDVVNSYRENLKHQMYVDHGEFARNLTGPPGPRNYYLKKETIDNNWQELARLDVGDAIFAAEDKTTRTIASFGKNVNFLWPSGKAPRELLGKFVPRESLKLGEADPTEATFGFAGPHAKGGSSHPFRARVRFETFWADKSAHPEQLQLRYLISPEGTKLKARPLYLKPRTPGITPSYDEADRLRGRKFYWHQTSPTPPQPSDNKQATHRVQIEVLPKNTNLTGRVHFENLTAKELGALLVCLDPNLYFQTLPNSKREYGWKIGKGKPRGLGSVQAHIDKLELRRSPVDAYCGLNADPLRQASDNEISDLVSEFTKWITPGKSFVKDLEHLLCLPGKATAERDYLEPIIDKIPQYGWMPNFDDPRGEPRPQDGRPPAMKPAREIPVP